MVKRIIGAACLGPLLTLKNWSNSVHNQSTVLTLCYAVDHKDTLGLIRSLQSALFDLQRDSSLQTGGFGIFTPLSRCRRTGHQQHEIH